MRGLQAALVAAGLLSAAAAAQASTWNVSTFSQLRTAAINCGSGDEILIAPGYYHVTGSLYVTTPNVTFRGASGNRDDVVLYGNGMNVNSGVLEGLWTAADGIQVRDLTVKDFWHHGIHVCGAELADRVVISNVKIQNCGERYIKGSGEGISNDVLVENVYFLQTEAYQPRPGHPVDEYNYIGGIDAMHTNRWIVRDCRFEGIVGAANGGRGAIFMWNGCTDATIERNVILGCATGIALGNGYNPNNIYHSENALVRNNFIVRGSGVAFDMGFTKNDKLYNNTVYGDDPGYWRALYVYGSQAVPTVDLDARYNLIRGGIYDNGWGTMTSIGNITGPAVAPGWFVNPAAADLHLTAQAVPAIDHAALLAAVPEDFDRQARPFGAAPDIGADEFIPEPAALALAALGGLCLLRKRR